MVGWWGMNGVKCVSCCKPMGNSLSKCPDGHDCHKKCLERHDYEEFMENEYQKMMSSRNSEVKNG